MLDRRPLLSLVGALVALSALLAVSSAATAEKQPPPRSDRQAYPRTYHIWGTDRPAVARYDIVVGYAYWNLRALRNQNPNAIFLLGPGLQPKNGRDYLGLAVTYGALERWDGGTDRVRGGPKLGRIRAFDPYWDVLHNADGSRAEVNATFRHVGWNLADPQRKGTAALVAKVFAHASKRGGLYRNGWDGVHSDNWIYRIGVGWFYGSSLDTDRDGRVDDYTVLRRNWASGLTHVGSLLRKHLPGKIVGGNGNWSVRPGTGVDFRPYLSAHDDHLRTANYTLLEGLELYASRVDEVIGTVREWLGYRDPLGMSRYFAILHKVGGEQDFRSMRWGLSLSTIAGAHYGSYAGSHGDTFWYDEYDGGATVRRKHWLGKPISAPRKLPNGVWSRAFKNGFVLNNSTSSPQTVSFTGVLWHLKGSQDPAVNSGAAVTDVIVPAQDGIFLLRRPDGSTPAALQTSRRPFAAAEPS